MVRSKHFPIQKIPKFRTSFKDISRIIPEKTCSKVLENPRGEGLPPGPCPNTSKQLVGGRLSSFRDSWEDALRWHRKVVQDGLGWRFSSHPPLSKNLPNKEVCPTTNDMLRELLHKQVFEPCFETSYFCQN